MLAHTSFKIGEGSYEEAAAAPVLRVVEGTYETQTVQHCHIEEPVCYAYMEKGRVVVVSSTQIPHIVRRVCSQATGLPFGKIRVVKPYIGGGFGNKQEVLYEPLAAFLTMQAGSRPVEIELSREGDVCIYPRAPCNRFFAQDSRAARRTACRAPL